MIRRACVWLVGATILFGSGLTGVQAQAPRIRAIGDLLLAVHAISNRSIPDYLEPMLGEPVISRVLLGARMIYRLPFSGNAGLRISAQFRGNPWDGVVLSGGGADL